MTHCVKLLNYPGGELMAAKSEPEVGEVVEEEVVVEEPGILESLRRVLLAS